MEYETPSIHTVGNEEGNDPNGKIARVGAVIKSVAAVVNKVTVVNRATVASKTAVIVKGP